MVTFDQIQTALRSIEPGSELERVAERWQGFSHTVQVNGKWRLAGFVTCFQHLGEMMSAVDPSIEPRLPLWCFDPEFISRSFNIPLKELISWPDGPGESGVFYLHGNRYHLKPVCSRLVSALWAAPDRSLPLEDVLLKVWNLRRAAIHPRHAGRVRTCASRIGGAIPGIAVSVKRDPLIGRLRVSLDTCETVS